MLHPEVARTEADGVSPGCWRVSSGSAAVLGLRPMRMNVAPTTAYLMLGARCARDCAFCAQARSSRAAADALSRVHWPEFDAEAVAKAVAAAHARGDIARACFQVTVSRDHIVTTARAVAALWARAALPVCASVLPRDLDDVALLLEAGAERVTIALDAASERAYARAKGGNWATPWRLLEAAAARFAGRVGTHLIVGLGESEHELAETAQRLVDMGVTIGLFAFTPVAGTALAAAAPPALDAYRRAQAVLWLMARGLVRAQDLRWDDAGRIVHLGLPRARLAELLADGQAFRTSGCPGCNRPYYNERPGGPLYNYPRPLTPDEASAEVGALLDACVEPN